MKKAAYLGLNLVVQRPPFPRSTPPCQRVPAVSIDCPVSQFSGRADGDSSRGSPADVGQAIEAEVAEWIDARAHLVDEQGRRQVVRNGLLPKRKITTGVGQVEVQQPRVRDRRPAEQAEPFTSKILPPYLRKTKSIEELIPWLYLKGVSTGDFSEALKALVGPDCPGLSATTVTRLKSVWEEEFQEWNQRSLEGKQYVYVWADGVHFNIRLEEDRQCILVLMGATADGKKELIAVVDGFRESEQSWKGLLLDVKARGLAIDPKLAIGDGALGFWKALQASVSEDTRATLLGPQDGQRAGQTAQAAAAGSEGEDCTTSGWPTRGQHANQAFDLFVETYEAKYPEGRRVPDEGSRSALGLLRLPGRALDSPADDQPDRIHLRHGAVANETDQGERLSDRLPDDGLQADAIGIEEMAALNGSNCYPTSFKESLSSTESNKNKPPPEKLIHNF